MSVRYSFITPLLTTVCVCLLAPGYAMSQSAKGPAKQQAPASNESKEYFVDVHTLPQFCVSKSGYTRAGTSGGTVVSCPGDSLVVAAGNAAAVAKILTKDNDYGFVEFGSDRIAIYRKGAKPDPNGHRLDTLIVKMNELARPVPAYVEIVTVARGTAQEIAARVPSLNSVGIVADSYSNDEILLKSDTPPDRRAVDALKRAIETLGWQRESAPPSWRLFHLDASTVVKSLSSNPGSGSDGNAKSDAKASGGGKDSSSGTDGNAKDSSGGTPTVQVTVNTGQQPDSGGGTNAAADASKKNTDSTSTTGTPKPGDSKGKSSDTGSAKPLTMQSVNGMLVFSNAEGSDRGITERTRLMTILDLPRPEVLLNLWSMQASSSRSETIRDDAENIRETVARQNESLQSSIQNGWEYLNKRMRKSDFFDEHFYKYITQKFTYDYHITPTISRTSATRESSKSGQSNTKSQTDQMAGSEPQQSAEHFLSGDRRKGWGMCEEETYCLGYAHAFEPLRPTFTNILLALIASKEPGCEAIETIKRMSGDSSPRRPCPALEDGSNAFEHSSSANKHDGSSSGQPSPAREDGLLRCVRTPGEKRRESKYDCEAVDQQVLDDQFESGKRETLQLGCFQAQAEQSFSSAPAGGAGYSTSHLGLLRAAIADFLFNYKMATQYPHDFVPYDVNQSAQELNFEFNPLIVAFNRDVAAFMQHLQLELQCKHPTGKSNWIGQQNGTFLNDALVTVRGISGVESIVDTVTQSFFNATNFPNVTDLIKSVSDAEKSIPGVISGNLTAHEAAVLVGALNSVQPAHAKIGRQLTLDITPHTLAGASSAELDVKLTAQETADPTRYQSDKSSEDELSRVAKHNTTTKIRVDSLKLFDVSSFSAVLQRPKHRFPLIPPFFEVPFFGSFLGIPLAGAKEYHRSTAVVSAVIVPTAADLAYGIDFTGDRVCVPLDRPLVYSGAPQFSCHKAKSFGDLDGLPIREYHKAVVQCFASDKRTAYLGTALALDGGQGEDPKQRAAHELVLCSSLTFSSVPPVE